MDFIILLVSLDIIASKFLDCYTLSIRMENLEEKNNITKRVLEKMGIEDSLWLPFLNTMLLVGFAVWLLYNFYPSPAYQLLFIITGLFVTALNLGMAHRNYFGKKNFITERLLK